MSKNRNPRDREKMTGVTEQNRCPVCDGDHKCSVGNDGLIICGRRDGPVPGFRHLGPAESDPQFHLYRRNDDDAPPPRPKPSRNPDTPRDWGKMARDYAKRFDAEARSELADRLHLPAEVFSALPLVGVCGRSPAGRTYTFPECAADGRVVGIATRAPNPAGSDEKKMLKGGHRGLTIPDGWRERPGPVLLVEGPSDTLAMTAAGVAAIGRPSNTGGVRFLVELLGPVPVDRIVLVIGENDEKQNGDWPGRDGAGRTASALQAELNRSVFLSMTPNGAKDVRQWIVERVRNGAAWDAAGRELVEILTSTAEAPPRRGRPQIVVTTEEHLVNDAAAAALAGTDGIYQRGGQLVRVVRLVEPTANTGTVRVPAGATVIRDLCPALLREHFTRVADWVKLVEGKEGVEEVPTHPPPWAVQAVHARGMWPGVPRLDAVVTHPILLGDGSLLATSGYHRRSGVLMCLPERMRLNVPEAPTRPEVNAALAVLTDAVCDFPFERAEHRGSWLAGLLTPLAWFAFDGPSPFFLIDGNVRGIGKGLLADTIALPVLGRRFSAMTYTADRDELRKRITSVAAEGERMVLLDNLVGAIGNDQLDAALTSEWWKDRLLGGNRMYDGPLNVVWYGTGNNCELRADTSRRTCHIRMESTDERPEDRGGFKYPRLRDHLRRNRDALLSAALTILRGWVVAGRPCDGLPPWGSYESWSEVVRASVVWAGLPDPALTRIALQTAADRNALAMASLLRCLLRRDPDRQGLTASEIVEAAKTDHELRAAVEDLAGRLDTRSLGYSLRSFARRNFEGLFLDRVANTGHGVRWAVYPMSEFRTHRDSSPPSPPSPPPPREPGGDGGDSDDDQDEPYPDRLFDNSPSMLPDGADENGAGLNRPGTWFNHERSLRPQAPCVIINTHGDDPDHRRVAASDPRQRVAALADRDCDRSTASEPFAVRPWDDLPATGSSRQARRVLQIGTEEDPEAERMTNGERVQEADDCLEVQRQKGASEHARCREGRHRIGQVVRHGGREARPALP